MHGVFFVVLYVRVFWVLSCCVCMLFRECLVCPRAVVIDVLFTFVVLCL